MKGSYQIIINSGNAVKARCPTWQHVTTLFAVKKQGLNLTLNITKFHVRMNAKMGRSFMLMFGPRQGRNRKLSLKMGTLKPSGPEKFQLEERTFS